MNKLARLSLALVAIIFSMALIIGCGGEEEEPWKWGVETPTPERSFTVTSTPVVDDDICEPMPECIKVTVDLSEGDAERGKELFEEKGCVSCHKTVEDGPGGEVGPLLAGIGDMANRPMLAADIANTPENIWRWVQFPQKIKPGTEMAPLGMDGKEAADLVAYLQTLK